MTADDRTARKRMWMIFGAISIVVIAFDHATKIWAKSGLTGQGPVSVIENFWDWRLAYNTGSAFSMFQDATWGRVFLTVVGLIALAAIFWMVKQCRPDQKRQLWALSFIAGGAIGNLIDRILFGKVTDFVLWRYYEKEWPIFNIADVALCVGVGLLVLDMILQGRAEKARTKTEQATSPVPEAEKTAPT